MIELADSETVSIEGCFGVRCQVHGTCARYANVNGSDHDDLRMGTCATESGHYPQFLPSITYTRISPTQIL
jgi:hypothetical protein